MSTVRVICNNCHKPFDRPVQRGRPAVRCLGCRSNIEAVIQAPKPPPVIEATPAPATPTTVEITVVETPEPAPEPTALANPTYCVTVTNMGIAHQGESESAAEASFKSYSEKSQRGYGQVGHELVRLLKLNKETNQYEEIKLFTPQLPDLFSFRF